MKRLAKLLVSLGLIEEGEPFVFRRLYPGYHQRCAGAWSWAAERPEGVPVDICGSQSPLRDLLAAPSVTIYADQFNDVTLYPERRGGAAV